MTTLTATTIITAQDRASAVFGRVAASAKASAGRYQAAVASITTAAQNFAGVVGFLGPAAAMGIIQKTQTFEKRALGVAIAGITDAFEKAGDGSNAYVVNLEKIRREAEKVRTSAMALSRELGFSPTGLITAGEAAAKMGLDLQKVESVMRTSALMSLQDPDGAMGNFAEFLGTLSIQFKAPPDVENFTKWILQTGDMVALAASATRTSITRIQEGLRQFSGLYASLGVSREQTIALVAGMTQGGLADPEAGTALKAGALRLLNPTVGGLGVLSKHGLRRENYMNLSLADPRKAVNQIVGAFPGQLGKDQKLGLFKMLDRAQRDGSWKRPEFFENIVKYLNKATKAATQEDRDANALKVLNALVTSGGVVDMYKFFQDWAKLKAEGKVSDSDVSTFFDPRHISRTTVLLDQFASEVERVLGILRRADGAGLQAGKRLYDESSYGQYETAIASLERALIKLRESEAFGGLIKGFEKMATWIADLPKPMQQLAGYVTAAGVAMGTLSAAAWIAGPALTALTASPVIAGLAALTAGVILLKDPVADMAKNFDAAGRSAAELIDRWARDNFGPTTDAIADWFKRQVAIVEAEVERLTAGPLAKLRDWFKTNIQPSLSAATEWATGNVQKADAWFDHLRQRTDEWARKLEAWENSVGAWFAKQHPDNYSVGSSGPKPLSLLDLGPLKVQGQVTGTAELTVNVVGDKGVVQETRRMPLHLGGQLNTGRASPDTPDTRPWAR